LEFQHLKSATEGLLFVTGDEGLSIKQLAEVFEIDTHMAREIIKQLQTDFSEQQRGIQCVEIAGRFQLTTIAEHAPYFEKLAFSPTRSSLSQAALETLAIIAYRQPITRVEIEEIRGVKSERSLHTLTVKDLIEEVGRADAVGRPILYGTTKPFLAYFGLRSIKELPDAGLFQGEFELEEETKMLFDRFESKQMSMQDFEANSDLDDSSELENNLDLDNNSVLDDSSALDDHSDLEVKSES
jgi:segregation and condensation protein B